MFFYFTPRLLNGYSLFVEIRGVKRGRLWENALFADCLKRSRLSKEARFSETKSALCETPHWQSVLAVFQRGSLSCFAA